MGLIFHHTNAKPVTGPFYGDGTYYTTQGIYNGHCSYDLTSSLNLPFITNVDVTAAMNREQYANGSACGMCLVYRGLDRGCTTCGVTPFNLTWKTAVITDECPKCKHGDIDFALDGDGRWKIEWYQVECEVGVSKLHYGLQLSDMHYMKLQVSNSIYPISGVNVTVGGQELQLHMTMDNYYVGESYFGDFDFPMPIHIRDSFGRQLEDRLDLPKYGNSTENGRVQFVSRDRDTVFSFPELSGENSPVIAPETQITPTQSPDEPAAPYPSIPPNSAPESGPAGQNYFD